MLIIYAISDSIGETAQQVAKAAASQFKEEKVKVERIPYVKTLEDVEEVVEKVIKDEKAMIVSTIITVNLREYLTKDV